ncbi:UNVERIFIED_CONTAM: Mediator of RNA polymerase II transcription subunit [Sesamum calycinum]|uniref:Mediator of RNA polymerase II transcription subunit n=1 Tax=Sesamum calycinum TaxID=2727403 RepID=A0AAW2QWN6_9LAMI
MLQFICLNVFLFQKQAGSGVLSPTLIYLKALIKSQKIPGFPVSYDLISHLLAESPETLFKKMDVDLEISLDKLPIKRLEALEENGFERFPSDVGYDEKRVNLIRRIDFAWAVEREDPSKKQKSEGASAKEGTSTSQQQWPWQSLVENLQLAHQELSVIIDLINTNLGKYFKQSAKSLEEQIAREARFYGALISWHARSEFASKIMPLFQFEVLGLSSASNLGKSSETKTSAGGNDSSKEPGKEYASNDERVREIHLTLREVHRAIHDEQVFDLVNREACNPSLVKMMKQNGSSHRTTTETSCVPSASVDGAKFGGVDKPKKLGIPSPLGFEIYLRQVFHEHVFVKAKNKAMSSSRSQISSQPLKDNSNILGHFCMSLAHRIFSNKVLSVLENLVYRTPYVHLVSHPTWHSRTSSWTLSVKIPQSILHAGSQIPMPTAAAVKNIRSQFWTRVLVIDDSIRVEGEGAPNVVGLFRGRPDSVSSINGYDCDLVDLPIILLQQVASQVIQWLHEEALTVGIKANRDFLSLAFELDQGEIVRLVAHVDPEDTQGCISWWLTVDDGIVEEHKLHPDV